MNERDANWLGVVVFIVCVVAMAFLGTLAYFGYR